MHAEETLRRLVIVYLVPRVEEATRGVKVADGE